MNKKAVAKGTSNADIAKMIEREIARQSRANARLINKRIQPVEAAVYALADDPDPLVRRMREGIRAEFRRQHRRNKKQTRALIKKLRQRIAAAERSVDGANPD